MDLLARLNYGIVFTMVAWRAIHSVQLLPVDNFAVLPIYRSILADFVSSLFARIFI